MEVTTNKNAIAKNKVNNLLQIELPDGNLLDAETVKKYLVTGNSNLVTEGEIIMFLQQCKSLGLNPFLKDCFLIKFGTSTPAQIVVSYNVYKNMAKEIPSYRGIKSGIIVLRDNKMLELEGTCKMESDTLLGGWCIPSFEGHEEIKTTVSFKEVMQSTPRWSKAPNQMTEKCAIATALRNNTPLNLNGTYIEEELEYMKADNQHIVEDKKTTILEAIKVDSRNIQELTSNEVIDTNKGEKQLYAQQKEANCVEATEKAEVTQQPKENIIDVQSIGEVEEKMTQAQKFSLIELCEMDASKLNIFLKIWGYAKTADIPSSKFMDCVQDIKENLDKIKRS